jgi:cell division initiation protein
MRMRRSKDREVPRPGGSSLTPVDVQQVQFRLAFRGYNEGDVDAFLDRVTEDLTARIEERERLLRRVGAGGGELDPSILADARSEADAIIAKARAEASEIVRAAMAEAAAVRASAGDGAAAGGDVRGAVAPFLTKEREFLQNLGAVVQAHTEEIRGMVAALKSNGAPRSEA